MTIIIKWLFAPWHRWQRHRKLQRQIDELRKKDPFIYH